MTITLPDLSGTVQLGPEELKLELACALYARGRVGKIAGAEMAGVTFVTFQRALEERGIPLYTEQMLTEDLSALKALFSR